MSGAYISEPLLPSQTGNSGKYLTTDGSAKSWATIDLSTKQDAAAFLTTLVGIGGTSGSGNLARVTSPVFVTPALGTPSSGTVTNLTGTASININGTVGATTPTTVACTTLNASGLVTATSTGAHTFGTTNTVTMTAGVLSTIAGTKSAPALKLGYSASNTGLYGSAAGTAPGLALSIGGTTFFQTGDSTTGLALHSAWAVCWGSGAADGTIDTGLRRSAAGVVQVNNGTAGTLRDLSLRALTASESITLGIKTIATLPSAASSSGQRYQVSDSATIANRIAFSNGSAWYYEGTAVAV